MREPEAETEDQLDSAEAFAALERFVVENDDLIELETRIGRFNIFDALGLVRQEIRHSNFLAWLLDPGESHGQGQLFLRALLMDILRCAPTSNRPMSPVELDGRDLGQVEIRREWCNIDLLIVSESPRLVVAIENKIDSTEHSEQLDRYHDTVTGSFANWPKLFVYLTTEGGAPSHEQWMSYSYGDIHRVLSRVRRTHKDSIGNDVAIFVDHYLSLIGSRFMDDPKIDELVEQIYRNHRQTIDLIIERRSDPRAKFTRAFEQKLKSLGDWDIDSSRNSCTAIPSKWLDILPPVCALPTKHKSAWFRPIFSGDACHENMGLTFFIGPTTNPEPRNQLLNAIERNGDSVGLSLGKKRPPEWAVVYTTAVLDSKKPLAVDDRNIAKVERAAADFAEKADKITDWLKTIF